MGEETVIYIISLAALVVDTHIRIGPKGLYRLTNSMRGS